MDMMRLPGTNTTKSRDVVGGLGMAVINPLEEDPEMVAYFLESFGDGMMAMDHDGTMMNDGIASEQQHQQQLHQPQEQTLQRQQSHELPMTAPATTTMSMLSPHRESRMIRPASTPTTTDITTVLEPVNVRLLT